MLAAYLSDHGWHDFKYVVGHFMKPSGPSHAWLEGHGFVIDITADQFSDQINESIQPVYVSTNNSWHKKHFKEHSRQKQIADFRKYQQPVLPLITLYAELQLKLNLNP